MTNYLFRRLIQMIFVLLFSSMVTFGLLQISPGGPLEQFTLITDPRRRPSEDDIARIRARYELDLEMQWRFTRWLIGEPRGPLMLGGQELFNSSAWVVGCRKPVEREVELPNGKSEMQMVGCTEVSTLGGLTDRPGSRGILLGDFGTSWSILRDRPVSELLTSRLGRTLQLMITATLIAICIGVPLGIYSAIRQYSRFDYTMTTLSFIGSSMPTFFFGIIMISFLSVYLKERGGFYLPPGNAEGVRDYLIPGLGKIEAKSLFDQALRMVMPVTVLAMVSIAGWSRFVRASMLDVMRQDYVRTARAKGLVERVVIAKHALRNALIPFVTIIVFALPDVFGGAIITETIFNWPGMGRLYIDGLSRSDYPVSMALLFITAVLTVVATLLRDILYTVVDPRIRLS